MFYYAATGCCSAVLWVVVLQYWDQTNFSVDGTKAFKIGSNVLNLVFDDESVIVIVKFGLVSHIL